MRLLKIQIKWFDINNTVIKETKIDLTGPLIELSEIVDWEEYSLIKAILDIISDKEMCLNKEMINNICQLSYLIHHSLPDSEEIKFWVDDFIYTVDIMCPDKTIIKEALEKREKLMVSWSVDENEINFGGGGWTDSCIEDLKFVDIITDVVFNNPYVPKLNLFGLSTATESVIRYKSLLDNGINLESLFAQYRLGESPLLELSSDADLIDYINDSLPQFGFSDEKIVKCPDGLNIKPRNDFPGTLPLECMGTGLNIMIQLLLLFRQMVRCPKYKNKIILVPDFPLNLLHPIVRQAVIRYATKISKNSNICLII